MGWIRGPTTVKLATRTPQDIFTTQEQTKGSIDHVENISSSAGDNISVDRRCISQPESKYICQPLTVPDEDLPLITSEEVLSKRRPGALSGKASHSEERKDYWIVVDDIVYDCTSFILDHPGGEQVILSFVGENCSCMALLPLPSGNPPIFF